MLFLLPSLYFELKSTSDPSMVIESDNLSVVKCESAANQDLFEKPINLQTRLSKPTVKRPSPLISCLNPQLLRDILCSNSVGHWTKKAFSSKKKQGSATL